MPNIYYITKNGVPCKLDKSVTLHYKGLLKPCDLGDEPLEGINFLGKKKMDRAILRTERAIRQIRNSVIFDWDKLKWLTEPGAFVVQKKRVRTEATA